MQVHIENLLKYLNYQVAIIELTVTNLQEY